MFPWLSTFLMNPALAAGTAAVASPILIHLLARRRFRRIRWAAMDFLLEAQKQNRQRIKIEQLLLLFLRCLAVFLLAMMIARPFIGAAASRVLGVGGRTDRILLIDDSFSMGYRPQGGSGGGEPIFSRAIHAAQQILQEASQSGGDSLTVLLTSKPGEPAVSIAAVNEHAAFDARERLGGLRPSATRARMRDAIARVAEMVARSPSQVNTRVYVISDFQRIDWGGESAAPGTAAVGQPLAQLAAQGRACDLVLLDVGEDVPRHLAVTDLMCTTPQVVAGAAARFEASVTNFSNAAIDQVELGVSIGKHLLPPMVIARIPAGQSVREPMEIVFPDEGSESLRVFLNGRAVRDDGLTVDHERWAAVDAAPAIQVLVVDGQPSEDTYRDEVYLLKTALKPSGRAISGNEITTIADEAQLETTELSGYHVIVLANVNRVSLGVSNSLERFVRNGGGLIVFAGEQLDVDAYNQNMYRDGQGLLPGKLGEVVIAPESSIGFTFAQWDANHPLMRPFSGALAPMLRSVRVKAFISVDEAGRTALSTTSQPTSRPASSVLVHFNDPHESPAILQKNFGRGVCYFLATTADQDWNDWGASFSYLPFMMEMVQVTARKSTTPSQIVVGEPLDYRVEAATYQPTARLRTPGYPVDAEIQLTGKPDGADGLLFHYSDTRRTGLYPLDLTRTDGRSVHRFAAVNVDAAESNLARATRGELDLALAGVKFQYVHGGSTAQAATVGRQELWWPMLWAAAIVLMAEQSLAWWFGTRG